MASIPLPALSIKPIEQPDVLQNFARIQQLRGMNQDQQQRAQMAPLQMQAAQNEAQSSGIDLQNKQRDQQDQQAATAAFQKWDGKSYDTLAKSIVDNGGSYGAAQKVVETGSTLREKAAKYQGDQLDNQIKTNGLIASALASVDQIPDAELPQAIIQKSQDLVRQGLLDPQHGQIASQLAQSGDFTKMRAGIDSMRKGVTAFSTLLDEQKAAETKRHNQVAETNTAATAANTQAYQQAQLKQGGQRLGIEGARLAFQKAQAGMGEGGTPSSLAQSIASGHVTPDRMGYLLSKNPGLIEGVMQVDPSFDSSKAQAYPQVYKDFTSSKNNTAGGALNAGATALSHLKELSDMNTVASHIPGTPDYNAYQNKADTVASELAKFYGDATIPAIASIKKTLTAQLPGNRQAAIETQAQSMGDKFDSYQQTWENAAPSRVYQAPMPGISEKATAARAALDPRFKASHGDSTPAPQTHIFSLGAWQRANPKGDASAATAAAKQQGYQVVQ